MSMARGEIFLGDLMRAYQEIGATDLKTMAAIANLLGFRLEITEENKQVDKEEKQKPSPVSSPSPRSEPNDTPVVPKKPPEQPKKPPSPAHPIDFDFDHTPPSKPVTMKVKYRWPGWDKRLSSQLSLSSLLSPEWMHGILVESFSTRRDSGALDIQAMVDALARLKPLDQVPRLEVPTLARGCQVLIDTSPGMAPFAKDEAQLINTIKTVVGDGLVKVLYFEESPIHGVQTETNFDLVDYEPPTRKMSVLLVSDLGIGGPPFSLRRSTPDEWLAFYKSLREAECRMVALVPYPLAQWPPSLAKTFPIVQWDRNTTATTVRRARMRG